MKKKFFVVLYFTSPLLPIIVTILTNTTKYQNTDYLISLILGSSAFTWLSFQLILSSRPKFIESNFGLDKFIRFHIFMAVISLILVYFHKTFKWEVELGDIAFNVFIFISSISLLFMSNMISNKLQLLKKLKTLLSKYRITKYQYQVAIHNLTVIAVIVMFSHVILTSSVQQHIELKIIYSLYFGISFFFYLYHKIIRRFISSKNKFYVTATNKLSNNVTELNLKLESGKIFNFKPGQFGFLRITNNNFPNEEHPFSIISVPNQNNQLSFAIKNLGDYTSQISNIPINSTATIDGPYGNLSYLNYPNEKNIVLIAGGVGVTPMLSMLRYMNLYDNSKKVIFLWGVNTKSDILFHQEFLDIQSNMNNFIFIPVVFRDDSYDGEKGTIDKDKLDKIIESNSIELSETGFYICGPSKLMNLVVKNLKSLKIKKEKIHIENFNF